MDASLGLRRQRWERMNRVLVNAKRRPDDRMGRKHYSSGTEYYGELLNDKPHGKGRKDYKNGDWYEGEWKAGKRHGRGKYFYSDTNTWYEGEWRDNLRDGAGKLVRRRFGKSMITEVWWRDDKPHGKGIVHWNDGTKTSGEWEHGKLVKVFDEVQKQMKAQGCIEKNQENHCEFERIPKEVIDMMVDQ